MNPPPRRRRVAFSIALAVVLLFVLDGIVGLAVYFRIRPKELSAALPVHHDLAPHPYKSYILRPGQVFYKTGAHTVEIAGLKMDWGLFTDGTRVNDFGHQLRAAEAEPVASPKPPGEFRILFLGGSTTFLPWPFLIPEALARRGIQRNIKVISAGTGGYTSQENLIDLAITGFTYEPDLVVAYLPVNDIGQAAHYPGFRRDYTHMRVPLTVIHKSEPPLRSIRSFPFTLRLFDTIAYNRRMSDYMSETDLLYHTTRQPDPMGTGHTIDQADFDATVDAVIDNIFDMNLLCQARHIPFLLLTQKMFKVDHPYVAVIYERTLECGRRLMESPRLADIPKWNMQSRLPDAWAPASIEAVNATFPDRPHQFQQPLAYDDMHFTPGGDDLFAISVAELLATYVTADPKP